MELVAGLPAVLQQDQSGPLAEDPHRHHAVGRLQHKDRGASLRKVPPLGHRKPQIYEAILRQLRLHRVRRQARPLLHHSLGAVGAHWIPDAVLQSGPP